MEIVSSEGVNWFTVSGQNVGNVKSEDRAKSGG
jgi:hypothetical protein